MFKLFREYNKYILVVGCVILMIAFLLPAGGQLFQPGPDDVVIGTIDGEDVTLQDQYAAAAELQVLQQLPLLGQMVGDDPIRWLLLVHEAEELGLSASQAEVETLLQAINVDDRYLAQLLQRSGTTRRFVEHAVRHFLMVQDYRELVLGQAHTPTLERIRNIGMAFQFAQQGFMDFAQMVFASAAGSQRISEPLVRNFLEGRQARVSGDVVLVSHERYLDQVPEPTEAALKELFEQHRDDLPGASEPYGFGYKTPDRVRIEWLSIPIERVRETIDITEAEALEYYQANRGSFTAPSADPTAQPAVRPYPQAREQVFDRLRAQRAEQLAQTIVRTARNLMLEDEAVRRAPDAGGYRQLPEGFDPLPLERVATAIEERFGVRPEVRGRTEAWVPVNELATLPEIGMATLANRRDVPLTAYVASAREMEPQADNPLAPLRLQLGLPGEPLRTPEGSYHVFRLRGAQPAREPESLDEVREDVARDARRLAAYRLLLEDRDRWVQTAKGQGLSAVAAEAGTATLPVMNASRRGLVPGAPVVLPGIGPADALVEQMFELGQQLAEAGGVGDAPQEARIGSAGLDTRLSLAVFRLDGFQPMTQSEFAARAGDPLIAPELNATLMNLDEDPLSLEALSERAGYVPADDEG